MIVRIILGACVVMWFVALGFWVLAVWTFTEPYRNKRKAQEA